MKAMNILSCIMAACMLAACQPAGTDNATPEVNNGTDNGTNTDNGTGNNNGQGNGNQGNGDGNSNNDGSTGSEGTATLIVYYSYTGNTKDIVTDLKSLITADMVVVEPAEKGLKYEADNYAIGSAQISKIKAAPNDANSYPAIDPVTVDLTKYSTVIIATPLWWSQMSSNMQAFLFKYGKQMAGKNVGLIVSSYSSGISGVEADAKRLVPDGKFLSKSLWINNSNHSSRKTLIQDWLKATSLSNTQSTMTITVNSKKLTVDLVSNSSTAALLDILKKGSITYQAHDYGDFEKVGEIGYTLPQNNEQISTVPGDVILYLGNNICIYYGYNEWDFTRLGKIRDVTQAELKSILGTGIVTVTLSL